MKFNNSIITNQLFYSVYEGENSMYKDIKDYKTLLVLDYLYKAVNRNDMCCFSLEHMIKSLGYVPKDGVGRTIEQFKNILVYLQDKGYLIYDKDFKNIKLKEFVCCEVDLRDDDKFVVLPEYVEEKIMSYDGKKVNNLQLLFYWCYLASRTHRNPNSNVNECDDVDLVTGRASVCFVSYERINEDIGLTDVTIAKYNNILVELNLLRYDNNGIIAKNGATKESTNVYCVITKEMTTEEINDKDSIVNKNLDLGLKQQLYILEENGWKQVDKNNNKSIAGLKGALTKLKNQNRATKEQLDELENM